MNETLTIRSQIPQALLPSPMEATADWEGLCSCVVAVRDGKVISVEADSLLRSEVDFDASDSILLPGFLDSHTHLDKAHSWDRAPNRSGTFQEALQALSDDKVNWTVEDVYQRARFALSCAEAYGTVALRTHVDTGLPWAERSYEALSQLKREWVGRVELQLVSLCSVEAYDSPEGRALADLPVKYGAHALGGMPLMNPNLDRQLDAVIRLADERGVGLDFHVDESGNPDASCLEAVARAVIRNRFENTVVCGHCCSLAVKTRDDQLRTLDLVKQAGLCVVSLPMCNLYLQDRRAEGDVVETPYWRGITLAHEFMERDVPFACASDNVRDAFYAFGDLDMLEVYRESVRIGHLDRKLKRSLCVATSAPARLMDLDSEGYGVIDVGSPALFNRFHVSSMSKLLSRPRVERSVFRGDGFVSLPLPDYDQLGALSSV